MPEPLSGLVRGAGVGVPGNMGPGDAELICIQLVINSIRV